MLVSGMSVVSEARVGDVIGSALHTDIVVYINNYSIPSYAVNCQSGVVAEDLRNFGFDVVWNEYARSLSISRNSDYNVYPMHVDKSHGVGEWYTSILATDISVWAGGKRLTSYAMNGSYSVFGIEAQCDMRRYLGCNSENIEYAVTPLETIEDLTGKSEAEIVEVIQEYEYKK